MGDLQIFSS